MSNKLNNQNTMTMENTTKRTKKFYRDEINASYSRACKVFEEALIKYCPKNKYTFQGKTYTTQTCRERVSNNWNGAIEGFSIYDRRPKLVCVDLYIQGEDTDSCDNVKLSDFICKGEASASFMESYRNGYEQRKTARFNTEHLYKAMKMFAHDYLTPESQKKAN